MTQETARRAEMQRLRDWPDNCSRSTRRAVAVFLILNQKYRFGFRGKQVEMNRHLRSHIAAAVCGLIVMPAVAVSPAKADPTAVQVLDQFNLIVFGNDSSSQDVQGRALIGGSLSGTSDYYTDGTAAPASSYAALTVGGSQSGTVNVDDGGNVIVGGGAQNINLNAGGGNPAGTADVGGSITGNINGEEYAHQTVSVPNFQTLLTNESTSLSQLAANSTATIQNGNTALFSAAPNTSGVAIFDLTSANAAALFATGQISIQLNGATSVIVNVDAKTLNISDNFLAGSATKDASDIIWNFYDATNLSFGAEFGGTVLAPDAAVSNTSAIDGTLVASSFTQNGEMHEYAYSGTLPATTTSVPEPAGLALLGAGFLGLTVLSRRRRHG